MKDIKEIRECAESYYANADFFCSEAVLKAVVEGFDRELSHEVLAMSSGFPVGIGGAGCTCGALNGGVMALGYFFGRSMAKGGEVRKAMKLSRQLHDKFTELNRCTCCRMLTKGMEKGSAEHKKQCVRFTGEVAEEVSQIIKDNL